MRFPAVSSTYYSSDKNELKADIGRLIADASNDPVVQSVRNPGAFIVPHGWLAETGDVAATAYASLKEIASITTFVLMGTDHFGKGTSIAISRDDWRTPLGLAKSDRELADAIKRESSFADFDEKAHSFEHAIEVQLPFLQSLFGEVSCVEISVASHSYEIAKDLATAIDKASIAVGREIVLIGTTDFSRDRSPEDADGDDGAIIGLVNDLRARDVMDHIEGSGSSICGPAVLGATMIYAELAGLTPKLLKRKVIPSGRKDLVRSFVSFAFEKIGRQ